MSKTLSAFAPRELDVRSLTARPRPADPLVALEFTLQVVAAEEVAVCHARETDGLTKYDRDYEDILARWDTIMAEIASTPAIDRAGVDVKYRVVAEAVVHRGSVQNVVAAVARSALEDAERIDRGA